MLVIIIVAIVTMTVGNLAALGQDNIKRMLAYSSIAHTGYIMVGLAVFAAADDPATRASGIQGVLFYSVAYAFMNLGAFACVSALQRRPGVTSQIATFSGLGLRSPLLALAMTLFLLSLTGIPPLAGFFAKAVIVLGALEVGGEMTIVAVILMLNAAAAAFYYLRVVVYMYMRQPAEGAGEVSVGNATRAGLILAAIATVAIGLAPLITGAMLDWTEAAAVALVEDRVSDAATGARRSRGVPWRRAHMALGRDLRASGLRSPPGTCRAGSTRGRRRRLQRDRQRGTLRVERRRDQLARRSVRGSPRSAPCPGPRRRCRPRAGRTCRVRSASTSRPRSMIVPSPEMTVYSSSPVMTRAICEPAWVCGGSSAPTGIGVVPEPELLAGRASRRASARARCG